MCYVQNMLCLNIFSDHDENIIKFLLKLFWGSNKSQNYEPYYYWHINLEQNELVIYLPIHKMHNNPF